MVYYYLFGFFLSLVSKLVFSGLKGCVVLYATKMKNMHKVLHTLSACPTRTGPIWKTQTQKRLLEQQETTISLYCLLTINHGI